MVRRRVHLRAPAKVNLRLEIVGRREDGYHLLRTWIYPISLWDELVVQRGEGLEVSCDHPEIPKEDLCFKAARLFFEELGLRGGARIELKKGIPVGAGLGGGSSDAAAVLKALRLLWAPELPMEELMKVAAKVGADVPFFLVGGAACMGGIGEELIAPLPPLDLWLVLVHPGEPLSTAEVYRLHGEGLTTPRGRNSIFSKLPPKRWEEFLYNALEEVAQRLRPSIGELKELLLREGAQGVSMSGSGPTVFGIFNYHQQARRCYERLKGEEDWQVFLVRLL